MEESEDFYNVYPSEDGGYLHVLRVGPHQAILMYRNIYRGYSETPATKGHFMNPKLAKKILKIGLTVATIVAYGSIHKAEKAIGEKIDKNYSEDKPEGETKND